MKKPQLLYTTPQGATIHRYDLEGGKTTYERFLGCYRGVCEFHTTFEEARNRVSKF